MTDFHDLATGKPKSGSDWSQTGWSDLLVLITWLASAVARILESICSQREKIEPSAVARNISASHFAFRMPFCSIEY